MNRLLQQEVVERERGEGWMSYVKVDLLDLLEGRGLDLPSARFTSRFFSSILLAMMRHLLPIPFSKEKVVQGRDDAQRRTDQ